MYRASFASNLGLAYQITKNPKYATKAREALLNIDTGTFRRMPIKPQH